MWINDHEEINLGSDKTQINYGKYLEQIKKMITESEQFQRQSLEDMKIDSVV